MSDHMGAEPRTLPRLATHLLHDDDDDDDGVDGSPRVRGFAIRVLKSAPPPG